jgi:hypothetical protein
MLFQQLKKNFLDMDLDEQLGFLTSYVEARQNDLNRVVVALDTTKAKKSGAKKDKQVKLTSEQMKLLRQLGLV